MSRRTAAPFLRLDSAVAAGPWLAQVGDGLLQPLQDITPDWDYAAPFRIGRTTRIDHDRASSELGLEGRPFELEMLVEVGTGPGSLPRQIVHLERIRIARGEQATIALDLDSSRLSAQISLRTSIVLAGDIDIADPLAPRRMGARLWDDRVTSRIEGDDPRFPMEVISFSERFAGRPHEFAPWTLVWNPVHPGRDFHGAARLYLNADETDFVRRVQDQDALTLQALMGDVVSQMCEMAFRSGWEDELEGAEPGSLAGRIAYWLERAFPDRAGAQSVLEQRPGDFRSALLASVRL